MLQFAVNKTSDSEVGLSLESQFITYPSKSFQLFLSAVLTHTWSCHSFGLVCFPFHYYVQESKLPLIQHLGSQNSRSFFFPITLSQHSKSSQQTLVYWHSNQSGARQGTETGCSPATSSLLDKMKNSWAPWELQGAVQLLHLLYMFLVARKDPASPPPQRLDVLQPVEALIFHVSKNLIFFSCRAKGSLCSSLDQRRMYLPLETKCRDKGARKKKNGDMIEIWWEFQWGKVR